MSEKVVVDLSDMRKAYTNVVLYESDLPSRDPLRLFDFWFQRARNDPSLSFEEVNAVSLATVSPDNKPSCRMVLLKSYGDDGFRFFTNYNSKKGVDLEHNPHASILVYWARLNQQFQTKPSNCVSINHRFRKIRVDGRVMKLSAADANDYWNKRPLPSRASAAASNQSQVVPSREYLMEKFAAMDGQEIVERPDHWGGYLLKPDKIEFWQGHSNRLHDRILFRKMEDGEKLSDATKLGDNGWVFERLAP